MSMYNSLFGKNPNSKIILRMIGLTENKVPRFRDCTITNGEIQILTRTGGFNRELKAYEYINGWDQKDEETECNIILENNSYYLRDADDSFDNTYAYWYFSIPEEFQKIAKELTGAKLNASESFSKVIDEMKKMKQEDLEKDERFKPLLDIVKQITEKTENK